MYWAASALDMTYAGTASGTLLAIIQEESFCSPEPGLVFNGETLMKVAEVEALLAVAESSKEEAAEEESTPAGLAFTTSSAATNRSSMPVPIDYSG